MADFNARPDANVNKNERLVNFCYANARAFSWSRALKYQSEL